MPIGLGTAALIGAGVAGVATVASGAMASHAQSSAAQQAATTEQNVATENNQLARDMYAKNEGHLTPFMNAGMAAGDEYMGLLLGPNASRVSSGYFPVAGTAPTTTPTTTGGTGSTAPATTPWSSMTHITAPQVALAGIAPPENAAAPSALAPVIQQHAADAIAAGANPAAVAARAAQYGVAI